MSSPSSSPDCRLPVAILGCTGVVGQRFIDFLSFPPHPLFRIVCLAASERSAGRSYEAVKAWKLDRQIPSELAACVICDCSSASIVGSGARVAFSALDAAVAGPIELDLARSGIAVFSNARNHRTEPTVPILIPQANADHLSAKLLKVQRLVLGIPVSSPGFIVTNSNCSSAGLAIVLKPIYDRFGLKRVFVATLQAVSGAGLPGVPSLDILDNIIPYISGEEEKIQWEPRKILGRFDAEEKGILLNEQFQLSAHCHRVAVLDGHTESISFETEQPATKEEIIQCLRQYRSEAQELKLPSAPEAPIYVFESELDRPQPRLDRWLGRGMMVSVGRVRECPLLDWKLVLCSHNTVLGAAGGSIQNAELALKRGLIH